MTAPRTPTDPVTHAAHDLLAIAELADQRPDDLSPEVRRRAEAQLAECLDCADLHADLLALAAAAPTAAIPRRPRDFRLTEDDAARLGSRGWRRFLAGFGSPRDAVSRPLAIGLTTLGLVGILVGTVPAALPFASSGATRSTVGTAVESSDTSGPTLAAPGASGAAAATEGLTMSAPPPSVDDGGVFTGGDNGDGPAASAAEAGGQAAPGPTELAVRDDPSGRSALIVVAGALLIAGLGLFALRWSARRG
ncbi:MAG TPA: hypothetical protein VD763_03545 [Candidatus Saccharimonadales bacterium]|nr:hypothetical protein [Candidatus Saccharimonadales bacterium]